MTQLRVLDPTAYTAEDVAGTLAALGPWWAQLVDGRDEADALVISQAADAAATVSMLAASLGVALPPPSDDDLGAIVAWLEAAGTHVGAGVQRAGDQQTAAAALAMVTAVDDLLDAGDRLRAAGVMPGTRQGVVASLQRSDGGVPKEPVPSVTVTGAGVAGDRQATRRHHGRPWQALCLWSGEVIDALAADGHDVAPGHVGENVTIRGLPWPDVRSGVRLRLGEVLAEVSVFALPCRNNARWFSDRQYERIHHRNGPVSRVYAYVLEPGRIAVGDPAILEPDELTGAYEGGAPEPVEAEAGLDLYAAALVAAVEAALPGWVERQVARVMQSLPPATMEPAEVIAAATAAGERARHDVGARLRALLTLDIDAQRTNPLSILRGATRYPTEVLVAAGVPPVRRDVFKARAFPDDVYDLSPATWADIDESVHEPGIVWSAWKAHEHLRRRR